MIRVRCPDGEASETPPDSQDAPRRTTVRRAWVAAGARCHSPGHDRRAARVYAQPGGRGSRPEPLHLRPARPPLRRDDRDAMGCQADPSRRARAIARRTERSRQATPSPADSRPAATRTRRRYRTNPNRASRRRKPAPDRSRTQRRPNPDRTRRHTVVALDDPLRPRRVRPAGIRSNIRVRGDSVALDVDNSARRPGSTAACFQRSIASVTGVVRFAKPLSFGK